MKLRAAVVGVGYLGQFHAQKIKAHPLVELVGVCDFSFTQAQKVATELSTQAYQRPEELFGKIDFVHIAASTQSHYDLANLFLQQKIPVLVEKPIAASIEQAEKLCELSDKNNTLLTVGHIERFNPAFRFLKENSTDISYLEINRLAPFRTRGSDVSVLHDLTIHDIDLVSWIFKSPIEQFEATGSKLIKATYDDVWIRLMLKNGTQITLNNSRVTPQIIRNYRAVSAKQSIYMNTATLEAEILTPQTAEPFCTVNKIQLGKVDALALEVDHFIQCILGKDSLAITAVEATEALKNVEKFILRLDGKIKGSVH
ncbi:MAG: Gfo/Idh/MocA family oxidoreductase [Bdellovibrionota bacterium]|mgnify:CR=1 FL=1